SATYSIDLAIARQHTAKSEKRQVMEARQVRIGDRGAKFNKGLIGLFQAIAGAYTIKLDISHRNTYVIAYGVSQDLDLVEAMYSSLVVQMVDAGNQYLKSGEYKNETVWSESKWEYVPMHGTTARVSFN